MTLVLLDSVIRNAEVVDGTGGPSHRKDVGIRDGKIAQIGSIPSDAAVESIDAEGLCLSPGFIDLHTHVDASIHDAPAAEAYLRQGVTLAQVGNCGFSGFPMGNEDVPLKRRNTDPDLDVAWGWPDLSSFTESVRKREPGINYCAQIGHLSLRTAVVGSTDRKATAEEILRMCDHVRAAARAGASGMSFGLTYAPGRFADADELRQLAVAAAESNLLISCHMRDEGDGLDDSIDEILGIAELAHARLQISHLKVTGRRNHGTIGRAIARIESARRGGLDVAVDVYPYTASSMSLMSRLSDWAVDGGPTALLTKLADPEARSRIVGEFAAHMQASIAPDDTVIADAGPETGDPIAGLSLAQLGARWSVPPAEAAVRALEAHRATVQVIDHSMSEDDVVTVLNYPYCAIGSDGKELAVSGVTRPHPRSFGTFPRVLGRYVRERQVFSVNEAVRRMTSLPAARLGLRDRGVIAVGAQADLVLFDSTAITDRSTFADPWQTSEGVRDLFIGGRQAIRSGELTEVRAGKFVDLSVVR